MSRRRKELDGLLARPPGLGVRAFNCTSDNVADANSYPKCADDPRQNRWLLLDQWRGALVKQMLTPAPDIAAVNWKRMQLRAGRYRFTDVKPERLQRAIDADVEWLAAHPTRKSIAAARQSPE